MTPELRLELEEFVRNHTTPVVSPEQAGYFLKAALTALDEADTKNQQQTERIRLLEERVRATEGYLGRLHEWPDLAQKESRYDAARAAAPLPEETI